MVLVNESVSHDSDEFQSNRVELVVEDLIMLQRRGAPLPPDTLASLAMGLLSRFFLSLLMVGFGP